MSDSGVAGYIGGGGSPNLNRIDKITFSTDTKTTLSATLTTNRRNIAGMSNTGVAGYFGGGTDSVGSIDGIDKIAFPADTKTTLSATLTAAIAILGAFADCGVF